jgi:hypothetical protein
LQPHLALHEGGARSRGCHCEREDQLHSVEDGGRVLAFEGIEEEAVPAVDADLDEKVGDHQTKHA